MAVETVPATDLQAVPVDPDEVAVALMENTEALHEMALGLSTKADCREMTRLANLILAGVETYEKEL